MDGRDGWMKERVQGTAVAVGMPLANGCGGVVSSSAARGEVGGPTMPRPKDTLSVIAKII